MNNAHSRGHHLEGATLGDYAAGGLDPADADYCQQHLLTCADCSGAFAIMCRALYTELPAEELESIRGIAAAINVPSTARCGSSLAPSTAPRLQWLKVGSVVAAIALVGVFGTMWYGSAYSPEAPVVERPFEARLSDERYLPFVHTRGAMADGSVAAVQIDSDNLDKLQLGRFLLLHGRPAEARNVLDVAAKEHVSASVLNDLGVAYLEAGGANSVELALQTFQKALALDPHDTAAIFNAALACDEQGDAADADKYRQAFLTIDPKSSWAEEVRNKLKRAAIR